MLSMPLRPLAGYVLSLVLVLVLSACSDDDPTSPDVDPGDGPGDPGASAEITVTPAGGTFSLFDGTLILTWPADAFAADVDITVTRADPPHKDLAGVLPGTCFTLEPEDLVLDDGQLDMEISYDPADLTADVDERGLRVSRLGGNVWLPQISYPDPEGHAVRTRLNQLATFGVVLMTEGTIHPGSPDLTTAADLEAWGGYAGVAGTLEITATDITAAELAPLANLEWVTTLEIVGCATLDTLRLPALRHVDNLEIRNNPLLRAIELPALEGVGGNLLIRLNDSLTSIALASLEVAGGDRYDDLALEHNPALTSLVGLESLREVVGALKIWDNDLASLTGLDGVERVGHLLGINEDRLSSLGGLGSLARAGEVNIWDCAELDSLSGLNTLETVVGRLRVQDCPQLVNLHGLDGLVTVQSFVLSGCHMVASMQGFGASTVELGIQLWNNGSLSSLSGLEGVGSFQGLSITDCHALQDLTGLPALPRLAGIELRNMGGLTSLTGLESLVELMHLTMENCPGLTDFAGLDNLGTISSLLYLLNMNGLQNMDHLDSLTSLGGLSMVGCDNIVELLGLSGVTRFGWSGVEANWDLIITDNNALEGVRGLHGLLVNPGTGHAIPGDLRILRNEELTTERIETFIETIGGEDRIGGSIEYD